VNVRLLLTRPKADAERTAAALRARGHNVVIAPLLHIEPIADADIGAGPWAAILITSANAAPAAAAHGRAAELRALPVFAVGDRSASAMRDAGFAQVTSAGGGVEDLAQLVADRMKPGAQLLYLAGAERSGDLAGALGARNFIIRTVVIYRAVAVGVLPRAAAVALTQGVDGVLHFSRRSAEAYVHAVGTAGLGEAGLQKPAHFCLAAAAAELLTRAGVRDIRVAPTPSEAALIALIPHA